MMIAWRIIRRLVFLFIAVIISANTIAYVVINNAFVHDWMKKEINAKIFNVHGFDFDVGKIYVNFLESRLEVNDLVVSEKINKLQKIAIVSKLTVGFYSWNPVSWVPRARYLAIEGWSVDLSITERLTKKDDKKPETKFDLHATFDSLRNFIGHQIEFKNGVIFRKNDSQKTTDLKISDFFLKYDPESQEREISLILKADRSNLCLSVSGVCASALPIESAALNLSYTNNRRARLESFEISGSYGRWTTTGDFSLSENFTIEDYNLRTQGESEAGIWFQLGGLPGSGSFSANLNLSSRKSEPKSEASNKQFAPIVGGKVSWKNLSLDGFDIYSGSADVAYSERIIRYQNAQLFTPGGAIIEAYGEYNLQDRMQYSNHAKLKNMTFVELMAGLDAPTNVVNFTMSSSALKVGGEINPGEKKGFILVVEGDVDTTNLTVPSFEKNKRNLPQCKVRLKLESDSHHMTFKGSSLTCDADEEVSEFVLQKGILDYDLSRQEFRFTGSSVPASIVSYFVDEDISGSIGLRGSILGSKKTGVVFSSDVQINDANVYNLDIPRVSGRLEIDEKNLKMFDVEGWFDDDRQTPNIDLNFLRLGFNTSQIEVEGGIEANVSDLFSFLDDVQSDILDDLSGFAVIRNIKINGNYRKILNSSIEAKLNVKNFSYGEAKCRSLQATLLCQSGWCSGSRVFAQDLFLGQQKNGVLKKSDVRGDGLPQSTAIVEIESFSERAISIRTDIKAIPFRVEDDAGSALSGKVDLRGSLQGGWKDWELSASARVDELKYAEHSLGSIVATGSSHGGGPLNVIVSGVFDQAQARFVFDHSLRKSSEIYLSLRSLELFKYIPSLTKSTHRLNGVLSAELSMDGPGLAQLTESGRDFVTLMTGHGLMRQARVQFGSEAFNLAEPMKIRFEDGELSYSPLLMKGELGELRSSGSYLLSESRFLSRVEGNLDAVFLPQLTGMISQSSGNIIFRGNILGDRDGFRFRGESRFENIYLSGRYFSPPLTALNGRVVFQDSKIEIPQMTATKGNGQIDLVGSVDLKPSGGKSEGAPEPSVALRMSIRSAQFRWPQEIFETAESTLDGQVELAGRGRPYLLNGDVRVLKGRAYRDATCQEMLRVGSASASVETELANSSNPLLQLNLSIEADNNITLQTSCIRGRLSSALKITGTDLQPIVAGQIRLDNGQLTLLKTRFEVTRADAFFDNLVQVEPRLEAQMVAKIEKYSVFVGAEGPLSRPRLNLWSDPSVGPDGMALSRQALIRMISTNRGPGETTQTAVTQALANGVVGFFDDPLSQAVSRITRGFVDRFELQPILESGQSSWRARVSRDLGEKFNLGLDIESNSQSLTGEIFINDSVNVLGGFDRRSTQIGTYSELKGGFRFQFGGN